jgi:hypothetical protein
MSQENVMMVRRAIDWVNRGDFRLAMKEAADDFKLDWSNSIGPLSGVYRGPEQVNELLKSSARHGTSCSGSRRRSSRWTGTKSWS